MIQLVVTHILWIVFSVAIAVGGGLFLTFLLIDKGLRTSLGLTTPWRLARFLSSGVLRKGIVGLVMVSGSDDHAIYVLNTLQKEELWDDHTFSDLKYIAKNHIKWQVRLAALEALVTVVAMSGRLDLRSMLSEEERREAIPAAREQFIKFVEAVIPGGS